MLRDKAIDMHVPYLPDTMRSIGAVVNAGPSQEREKASPILTLPVHLWIEIAVIKNDSVGTGQTANH